jgi:hypothetical protein
MNLSENFKHLLFALFFTPFNPVSWPTFSSMSCETRLKSAKKIIKNQTFKIYG